MAAQFACDDGDTIALKIDVSGDTVMPQPRRDGRVWTWEPDLLLTLAVAEALAEKEVDVTARPAIGGVNLGMLIIEGLSAGNAIGRFGTLTVPLSDGVERNWRAALGGLEIGAELRGGLYRCRATFVLGNRLS